MPIVPLIVPLISPLVTILRMLKEIAFENPAKARRDRLEKLYEPLFNEMLIVHRNYLSLFQDVAKALRECETDEEAREEIVGTIQSNFSEARREYEGLRTRLRAESTALIRSTKYRTEKRFLWAVLCYFLHQDVPYQSDAAMDRQIETLSSKGHDAVLDSPSSYLLEALSKEKDVGTLYQAVIGEYPDLSSRLSDVVTTFVSLKSDVWRLKQPDS